ncbi:FGGY family carbohydrate kinase [Streptomyces pathocidini]|uniref:FGGY family carbohydrate kinase n=1 Tax=Streptomyces pathocidini TaxID=1650571 RepID=A0ABW7UV46_9ACTN|nr:FGGY family carbohydrate kinase [Streptomyces pathocidini]
MTTPAILALDQGTSGTKALLLDAGGTVRATAMRPLSQAHPGPGRVEQDPEELWASVAGAAGDLLSAHPDADIAGVALSTQRESVLAWETATGNPLSPLLSWQDRRGAARCARLAAGDEAEEITARTGLPVDPMFSATKAAALLDGLDPDRGASRAGRIRVGTVDAWLLRRITGRDATELGNASRTQLLDLDTGAYSPYLLDLFGVPGSALPQPVPSTGPFGPADGLPGMRTGVPLAAVLADSHAALFAHSAGRAGVLKATYGSGSSLMALAPDPRTAELPPGLARTIAWQSAGEPPARALEANIAASGTAVRWAARLLGTDEAAVAALADQAEETTAVLVPAFEGLGAPYWDREAVAVLSGFSQAAPRAAVARAAIESVAFQVAETAALFDRALGPVPELYADGGASANASLMRLQADLCARPVRVSAHPETSALGAAHLAGLSLGLWTAEELRRRSRVSTTAVEPGRGAAWRAERLERWRDAVRRSRPTSPRPYPSLRPHLSS